MKALILVGGYGTRLRPLTLSRPKPLVEFCNQPMMNYQLKELIKVGVNHIILAVSYKAEQMNLYIEEQERELGIKITLSQELKPMGTAGPIALAREHLLSGPGEEDIPFFVLNSDIVCDYPFQQMIDFHKANKGQGTIVVTRVDEPSKYGVVVYDSSNGLVERFVEKPKDFISNKINAGLYILSKSILDRIPLEPTSIEKVTFPAMAVDKQLFAIELNSYWMDVGQPVDYLTGMGLYLNWLKELKNATNNKSICTANNNNINNHNDTTLATPNIGNNIEIIGNVLIDSSAKIGRDCVIGPDVCIGPNVTIAEGLRIKNSTILSGAILNSHSRIDNSIIGWNCIIGKWVRMESTCVLGEGVEIKDEVYLNGVRILPNKSISVSVLEPTVIM